MAKLLRGKHKGKEVRIVQFCNDWFHVDGDGISNQDAIKSPTALEFTDEEKERIDSHKNTGVLFQFYEWKDNRLVARKNWKSQ